MLKQKSASIIILFLLAISIILASLHYFAPDIYNNTETEEVSVLIFLATAGIALIAYFELSRSNKTTENQFLLNISNKWGSESIVRARKILHTMFVEAYREKEESGQKDINNKCKYCQYCQAVDNMSKQVLEMRKEKNEKGNEFVDLLNLLDFMEIVGFYVKKGEINIDDIDSLFGKSVLFFYGVFSKFIDNRQKYDKTFYSNFVDMQAKLQNKNDIFSPCLCEK